MADDEHGDEAAGDATAAVDITDLDWDVRLTEVQRIEADPDDDLEDLFAVKFEVDGPNAEAEIEITAADAADVEVVALALDTLHGALTAWADLIERRKAEMRAILSEP